MGLVVVASLKLTALSQRSLAQVRMREALLDDAMRLHVVIADDPLNRFGTSGDLSWQVTEKKEALWSEGTIDLDTLSIASEVTSQDINALAGMERRWSELEVRRGEQSLTLFLPSEEEGDGSRSTPTFSDE